MGHKSNEEIRDRIDQLMVEHGTAGFAGRSCLEKRIEDLEWIISDRPIDGIPAVVEDVDGRVDKKERKPAV